MVLSGGAAPACSAAELRQCRATRSRGDSISEVVELPVCDCAFAILKSNLFVSALCLRCKETRDGPVDRKGLARSILALDQGVQLCPAHKGKIGHRNAIILGHCLKRLARCLTQRSIVIESNRDVL